MKRTASINTPQQQDCGTEKPALNAPKTIEASTVVRPEFYSLPRAGGDPFFSLSRSWYYAAEKAGLLKLVRIRQRGRLRGVTRVAYDDVAKLFQDARK